MDNLAILGNCSTVPMKWITATHWKYKGVLTKLSPAIKLVYIYRLTQYRRFKALSRPYSESCAKVGQLLGLSTRSVKTANRALIEMGLISTVGSPVQDDRGQWSTPTLYKVRALSALNGSLINANLKD